MRKNSFLTVTDQFCGAGGSSIGATKAGVELRLALNHWKLAIDTHSSNFPNADHDCADISVCDPRRYPSTDVLITSPECFPAGTLILTECGLMSIEDVCIGDRVLTHKGRWRHVTNIMSKMADTVIVKGQGHPGLEVTGAHPFLVRRQDQRWDNVKRDYDRRVMSEPMWMPASKLRDTKYRWATPVRMELLPVPPVPGRGMDEENPEFWWFVGRWVADGGVRVERGEITVTAGDHDADEVYDRLTQWRPRHSERCAGNELRWRKRRVRTTWLFECAHLGLASWLVQHFGKLAHGKTIPSWALTMPEDWRSALLEGYLTGDGHKNERRTRADTVSKNLAVGLRLLAESLGRRVCMGHYAQHANVIEGRTVNVRDLWMVAWENNSSEREAFSDGNHSWSLVKAISPGQEQVQVFNISVEEDESYVADGIVVHNCTNHSLAKGKQRKMQKQLELFGKVALDPAEERSRATMFDVPRFAEVHKYNIIIVENVVDARNWVLWPAWLHAMDLLGYDHHIVYHNSMFSWPTPQSRDRMYVVFWRKGNRAPDLDIRPLAHCAQCGKNVNAIQVWKKPHHRWGRYRKQYLYCCPTCESVVEPYYYCAANAIDWSLPAQRIGDRAKPLKEKTLARIRVGLEKFGRQPIITDFVHSGHDPSKSRPVSQPWPTQIGNVCHALVTPFMVDLAYTHAQSDRSTSIAGPMVTQTSRQTSGLVVPPFLVDLRGENTPKELIDALSTVCATGNHHGLVLPFLSSYYGTGGASGVDEAVPTVTSHDRHAVVVPPFLLSLNHSDDRVRPVTDPHPTMMPGGYPSVVVPPFLVSYYTRLSGIGAAVSGVDEPVPTQPTWPVHYLAQPGETPAVEDCGFRMLQPHEIHRAMAFPEGYTVLGTARDKVKQLGNAVTPPVMEDLIKRCVATLQ